MYSQNVGGRAGHTQSGTSHRWSTSSPQHPHAPAPIELRVKDLVASRKFYSDLLGFVPAEGYGYSDRRVVLVSPLLAHGYRCIVLTKERRGANADGVMLELETSGELLDRYFLARLLGAPTSPLVSRGRSLHVCVHDLDGHRIELRTSHHRQAGRRIEATGRWGRDLAVAKAPGVFRRHEAADTLSAGEDPLSWFDSLCGGDQREPS